MTELHSQIKTLIKDFVWESIFSYLLLKKKWNE
jgi:hypothetical protein